MAIETVQKRNRLLIDKAWLRQQFAEKDAQSGFCPDIAATPQSVREMMLADGIKPEDNAFSREILRERYDEDA